MNSDEVPAPMPIMSPDRPGYRDEVRARFRGLKIEPLPWRIIEPHAAQAWINHGQTLERLRERGGLDASEAVAILEDRTWRSMDTVEAFKRLAEIVGGAS